MDYDYHAICSQCTTADNAYKIYSTLNPLHSCKIKVSQLGKSSKNK